MWWAGSSRAQFWVGGQRAAWAAGSALPNVVPINGVEHGLAVLRDGDASANRPRDVRCWVGGTGCRLLDVPMMTGVSGRQEAEHAARAWLLQHDQIAVDDAVTVGAWTGAHPRWPVAVLPVAVKRGLESVLGERMTSLRPWWSEVLMERCIEKRPGARTIAAYDGEAIAAMEVRDGRVLSAYSLYPIADVAAARRALLRAAMQSSESDAELVFIDWSGQPRGASTARRRVDAFLLSSWIKDAEVD